MILLEIIKLRRTFNQRVAPAGWQPTAWEVVAAEFRVLPLGRFIRDWIYWRWIWFWLSVLPPVVALVHIPFMTGCQAYFEIRDGSEYPALGRWYSYRWRKWKREVARS
ncbi:hypothetical protein [Agrobacterium tumefaciens]|uniref:Transmembrane protein n=1 Tax=Agrobacterium tumefaciens TaxID=358 RepID=A0A2L2LI34_AGRTU|nr:hypothetical protein [Agrobacterium tumefaciens]AVH40626.1 hypothetical protein At1D1609_05740 [Agrobacterium tumefaciens]AVH43989.1 hypothetical protein At1D1609_39420 [Agrobacterium tumefaciens]NSY97925.1 hypothetical protein [Agrobacterium tumefaciens]